MKYIVHISLNSDRQAYGVAEVEANTADAAIAETIGKLKQQQLYWGDGTQYTISCFPAADYVADESTTYGILVNLRWFIGEPVYNCNARLEIVYYMGLVDIQEFVLMIYFCGPKSKSFGNKSLYSIEKSSKGLFYMFFRQQHLICGADFFKEEYVSYYSHPVARHEVPFFFDKKLLLEKVVGRAIEDFWEYNIDMATASLRNATGLDFMPTIIYGIKEGRKTESTTEYPFFMAMKKMNNAPLLIELKYVKNQWTCTACEGSCVELEHRSLAWQSRMDLLKQS